MKISIKSLYWLLLLFQILEIGRKKFCPGIITQVTICQLKNNYFILKIDNVAPIEDHAPYKLNIYIYKFN